MAKIRLDSLLVERGLAPSRETAQRWIRAGLVLIDEVVRDKPGAAFAPDAALRVQKKETEFASRGGLKLEAALDEFSIDPGGLTAADFGASNGGFTDCLIKRGAAKVYAIDVGHGQLAYHLQTDPRVVVMDKTNCRHLARSDIADDIDLIVADLSFISVKAVLPAMASILKDDGEALVLIKPQFEIGKGKVGKKGVVRDPEDHRRVLVDCLNFFTEAGWRVHAAMPSPIQGKAGNREFIFRADRRADASALAAEALFDIVKRSHQTPHE